MGFSSTGSTVSFSGSSIIAGSSITSGSVLLQAVIKPKIRTRTNRGIINLKLFIIAPSLLNM